MRCAGHKHSCRSGSLQAPNFRVVPKVSKDCAENTLPCMAPLRRLDVRCAAEAVVPGIAYHDYKKLSERAQRLVRFCVADPSEVLNTGVILRAR